MTDTPAQLAAELVKRITATKVPRFLLGITGAPGSGKSTLARSLAAACASALPVAVIPQDGFHLPNSTLDALQLRPRKARPETFDASAFIDLLRALRRADRALAAPIYDRDIHEPMQGRITVAPEIRLVIVEGNYLLLDAPPWRDIAALLDETWRLDTPLGTCLQRVRARHIAGGLTPAQADDKIAMNDRTNAALIAAAASRADRAITLP